MSNFAKYGIAGIVSFLVLSAIWTSFGNSDDNVSAAQIEQKNAQVRAQRISAAKEGVPLLIKTGLVYKIEPENYRAYVDDNYWAQHAIDDKTAAATALGYFIQDVNGDTLGIDIYGARSGEKLGEWSERAGYRSL